MLYAVLHSYQSHEVDPQQASDHFRARGDKMCDLDIEVTLDEYKIVGKSEIYYRKQLGHDVREIGSVGYFTDEHTGTEYLWVQYYDYTTDERIRAKREKIIGLGQ